MSKFSHDDDNDDAKAIAIHRVFSENIRAKKKKKAFENIARMRENGK